jgi:hypothetical protein
VTACEHPSFVADVNMVRLTGGVEGGPLVGLYAEVSVACADCGEPVRWRGLNVGLSSLGPMAAFGLEVAHLPGFFADDPSLGLTGAGFVLRPFADEEDGQ